MAADEIHVGDIGTRITLVFYDGPTVVDISTANPKLIVLEGPDGVTTSNAGTFTTTGTDGSLYFDSVLATFGSAGEWSKQGVVTIGGSVWHSDVHRFTVYPNLI